MAQGRGFRRSSRIAALALTALVTGLFPVAPAHADPVAEAQAVTLPIRKIPALSRPGLANRLKGLPKMMPAVKGQTAPGAAANRLMPMRAGLNAAAKPASYPQIDRVSLSAGGQQLDGESSLGRPQAISGDGRFVVFATGAGAWAGPDEMTQVVLRDRQTGTMELISRAADGSPAEGDSQEASISADGRYVVFTSGAADLVTGDTNDSVDVFVYDRTTKQMERVSVDSSGEEAWGMSYQPSISDDGRYVAFTSVADNLADTYAESNVFVHDRQTHRTELISRSAAGEPADDNSEYPVISGNGRFVAFVSYGSNLAPDGEIGVFLRDRTSGTLELISRTDSGMAMGQADRPAITGDGSKVAFTAYNDLEPMGYHVFVRDVKAKKTTLVDTSAAGEPGDGYAGSPAISRDGSAVAFASNARNLTPNPVPLEPTEVYVKNLKTGAIRLVSSDPYGFGSISAHDPSLTTDGRYVAFASGDENIVPGDSNGVQDVFVSGPDETGPTLGQTRAGTPAVYLYAYHEATDQFEMAGIGVQSGKNVTLAVGPGFAADGWALEVYLSEITTTATLNKKSVDLADDGFSFALEIAAPGAKATTYTLDLTDLVGNKSSQAIQVQSYTKGPVITMASPKEDPIVVGADGKVAVSGKADQPLLEVCLAKLPSLELFDCTPNNGGTTFTFTARAPETGDYAIYGWNGALFPYQGDVYMMANLSTPSRKIEFDIRGPGAPAITSPALIDGVLYARSREITVSGTTEPYATVTGAMEFAGEPVTAQADKSGKFSLRFTLPVTGTYGESMLTLVTWDRLGNTDGSIEYPVVLDLAAPVLQAAGFMGETAEGYAWPESSGKYTIGITEKGAGVIALEFNEELATLKLNNKVVADYPDFYYDVEVNPTAASNAYAFEASDRAGNVTKFTVTVKVDTTAPTLTVKTPSANTLVGLTASGDGPMITLTGTANETLTGLAVLEDFGPDMDLEWVDAEVSGNGTNWSARLFLPAESGTHRYLVIGRDLAGNWSRPDPKSVRTVTIDTEAPVLVFDENAGPNSYQGDATLQLLAAPTTVVVKGTLSDTGSGPARVMIGSTEVKPKSAVQNFGFYQSIALKEGFTDLTIVGTDAAGNTSQSYRLRALVKTMIGTLTAKASFSTGKQFLTVSGTTDRAYLVDDQYIGVVPVTITVTKKSGGQVDSVTLDASTGESSLYNLSKGSFKYSFDMSGWSSGKYLVTITAGTPAEFPNVKPKTTTIIVTRP